ncbi:peptidase M23B (plasmid) [Pelobacter propionicus DSM 2379]|uniref:Peptidase M23B n=2 Tax=Pelobacter propionicus TaxID=29543 RepID=A0R7M7_PELPD|nr:peptidase M23B [Pelobacter propionicus DSM 2379]
MLLSLPLVALADSDLPVENGVVTSGVGWRVDPFGSGKRFFHRGTDIAVPVGTPVRATRKGRIVFAGIRHGYGSAVIIEHANGDSTLYGHNSLLRVNSGETVESGTVIAFSGNSGRSTGPHVHYEKIPGNRPLIEEPEIVEVTAHKPDNNDQRKIMEQKLDDTVSSLIRKIKGNSGPPETIGQGG